MRVEWPILCFKRSNSRIPWSGNRLAVSSRTRIEDGTRNVELFRKKALLSRNVSETAQQWHTKEARITGQSHSEPWAWHPTYKLRPDEALAAVDLGRQGLVHGR
jgi:hypothetical protein